MLMQELDKAADSVKEAKDSSRANTLLRYRNARPKDYTTDG